MSTNEIRDRNGALLSDAPSVRIPVADLEAMREDVATIREALVAAQEALVTATEDEKELARLRGCEAKLKAMTEWLEANQPDVFRRGLWDALRLTRKT